MLGKRSVKMIPSFKRCQKSLKENFPVCSTELLKKFTEKIISGTIGFAHSIFMENIADSVDEIFNLGEFMGKKLKDLCKIYSVKKVEVQHEG